MAKESIEDPYCNPKNPIVVNFSNVSAASFRVKNGIINTTCNRRPHLSRITGMDVYLKNEFTQVTGSFKERGALYSMYNLSEENKRKGVITASLGNHAQGMSYHGKRLNIPVTVVMPVIAPIMKIQACRGYGATVITDGKNMKEAKDIALRKAKELGLIYVNGYDHPDVIAGQGTLGLEIVEQVPDMDAVLVPVGGGGLIAGVAVAVKTLLPNVKVYGVESDKCAGFTKALEVGQPTPVPVESTLADGLAVSVVGYNAFATAKPLIDRMIVVKEEWIAVAILRLVELDKCVVEGAGACGLAAILSGKVDELKGKKVVLVLSGGNIDTTILGRVLQRGLAADGRLLKFTVVISDRPGGIGDLCSLLGKAQVAIKEIVHERAWVTMDIFSVEVKIVCETMDMEHTQQVLKMLKDAYTVIKSPIAVCAANQ